MAKCSTPIVADPCLPSTRVGFIPGISTRYIPACSPNRCEGVDCGMAAWWVNNSGTLDRSEWLKGWVINQLSAHAVAECDETQVEVKAGGWWADAFRSSSQPGQSGAPFTTGSKLWTLQGKRSNNETMLLAKHYAEEALNYLVSIGLATRIIVEVRYLSSCVLGLWVKVLVKDSPEPVTVNGVQQPDYSWAWRY